MRLALQSLIFLMLSGVLYGQVSLNQQEIKSKRFFSSIEIQAGLNSSTLRELESSADYVFVDNYYVTTVSNKIGYYFGIGSNHKLSKRFNLNARLALERKGVIEKTDIYTVSATGQTSEPSRYSEANTINDYLTLSIAPQLTLGKHSRFYFGIGPYAGLLTHGKIIYSYGITSTGFVENYDVGISSQIGYVFPIKKSLDLTIQFINSYGLTEISKYHKLNSFYSSWHNNTYSLVAGVRLNHKK